MHASRWLIFLPAIVLAACSEPGDDSLVAFSAGDGTPDYPGRDALLAELEGRSWTDNQLFDAMILGRPYAPPILFRGHSSHEGLLFEVAASEDPKTQRRIAEYLRAADYPDMADYLEESATLDEGIQTLGNYEFGSAEHQVAQQRLTAQLQQWYPAYISVTSDSRPAHFKERLLPADIVAADIRTDAVGRSSERFDMDRAPADIIAPVLSANMARIDRQGASITIIYVSEEIDPVTYTQGISSGGYWLIRSLNNGKSWSNPVYLGIQHSYPYVVLWDSQLPLWDGDTLRIEVDVLAFTNIQRPDCMPCGPAQPEAISRTTGRYIEADWNEITQDGDGDGIADLIERRLGLDARLSDSDSDGVPDGADMAPQIPHGNQRSRHAGLIDALSYRLPRDKSELRSPVARALNRILIAMNNRSPDAQYERRQDEMLRVERSNRQPFPATILRASPLLFSGSSPGSRVLVYDNAAISRLDPAFGEFDPASLTIFVNHAGTKAYVIWTHDTASRQYLCIKTLIGWRSILLGREIA